MAKFLLRALKAGERGRAEAPHVKSDDRDGALRATRCPSAPITALLFKSLNLSYPGLEAVKAAIAAGDQGTACDAVAQYYAASKHAPWLRHAAPTAGTTFAGGAVDAVMLNDTYLLRQTFLLTLSPFRSTDVLFGGAGMTSTGRLVGSNATRTAGSTGTIRAQITIASSCSRSTAWVHGTSCSARG